MNGAEAILRTLADCGVTACFSNPGTSEMQTVAAFDRVPQVRPVLCLFEGVATGAADGFARVAGLPASVLLHLGAGLANGGANLHNARRAGSPVVNIVGDHATFHRVHDAAVPLWARPTDELDRWKSPIGHPFRGVTYELNEAADFRRQGLAGGLVDAGTASTSWARRRW